MRSPHNVPKRRVLPQDLRRKSAGEMARLWQGAFWGVIVLALTGLPLKADLPDMFFDFDEEAETGQLLDSRGNQFSMNLEDESHRTEAVVKFGTGALEIVPSSDKKSGTGWAAMAHLPPLNAFTDQTEKMTIATWVRPVSLEWFLIFWRIASQSHNPGHFQFSYLGGDKGYLYFSVTGPGDGAEEEIPRFHVRSSEKAPLRANEWNHLAMTFDEGEIHFYVNGNQLGGTRVIELQSIPMITRGTPSLKGMEGLGDGSLVDDFAFFGSRALSSAEIARLYRDGLKSFLDNSSPTNL